MTRGCRLLVLKVLGFFCDLCGDPHDDCAEYWFTDCPKYSKLRAMMPHDMLDVTPKDPALMFLGIICEGTAVAKLRTSLASEEMVLPPQRSFKRTDGSRANQRWSDIRIAGCGFLYDDFVYTKALKGRDHSSLRADIAALVAACRCYKGRLNIYLHRL